MTDQPPVDHHDPQQPRSTGSVTNVSGGVDVDAQRDVNIGGDVVGRDKITEIVQGDKVAGDKVIEQQITATGRSIAIGKLNVPIVPLAAAVGIGLTTLLLIAFVTSHTQLQVQQILPTPTAEKMAEGTFNVLILEFGEQGSDGKAQATARSRDLSQTVYDTLLAQRDAFPDPIIKSSIAIRYGGAPITDEAAAAQIVEQLGADMLIYGNLLADGSFTPQFYISPAVRAQIDAALIGRQQVGTLAFTPTAAFGASTDLRSRASFFFFIATGLAYDVFGRAARSLEIYRQAEQQLSDWPEQGAGKEVLYFFEGQAALFQAQQTSGQNSADLLTEAEAALNKATHSNPAYARARIGLGSLYLVRLQRLPDLTAAIGLSDTVAMFYQYNQALTLARQGGDRQVEAVATLGLGTANYVLGGAYQFRDEVDKANAAFDEAARQIDASRSILADFKQTRLLAQADLALGAVFDQQAQMWAAHGDQAGSRAQYQRAQQAYQQCIARGQNSADRILLDLIIGQRCQPDLDRINHTLSGGS